MRAALAIAWNLVLETARRRSALVFFLLFSGFAVALPFSLEGEGTLRSRLQAAVTYGAGLPVFAISLATVFLSSGAISLDLERRRLHAVVTKPVRRFAILGGKLLGIIALDAVLLGAILAAVGLHAALGGGASRGSEELREAEDRFFQVRRSVRAAPRTPTAEEVRRLVESLSAHDAHGHAGPVDLESAARRSLSIHRIEPGSSAEIRFEGIGPCPPGSRIFIRYALFASPPAEAGRIPCEWTAATVRGGEAPRIAPPAEPPGIPREIAVPSDLVEEGVLRMTLASPARSGLTIFADPERIEALPVEGRFWSNAGLGFTAVLGRLVLLAAIGLLAGSLFGFPTACLLTGFIYCVGAGSTFLGEVFTEYSSGAGSTVPEAIGRAASGVGLAILDLLPDFAGVDPIEKIADGRAIPIADLVEALVWTAGLQAALALVVATLVLGRRELERGGSEA